MPSDIREKATEQLQAEGHRRLNSPLSSGLYLWTMGEISDADALVYISEAISENEGALLDFAKGQGTPSSLSDFGEDFLK